MLRPSVKLPLWAAVGLPAAAYIARGIIRGMYFAPDLPVDLVVAGLWLFVVIIAVVVRSATTNSGEDHLASEMDDADSEEGRER